jgi:pyridoxine 5-phosphate synthase
VQKAAVDCQNFGAEGITVHPRPDERHIRYQDVREIKSVIKTEYNIEGYPSRSFMNLVGEIKPDQVTLVPDPPDAITSSEGWNTIKCKSFLVEVIAELKEQGIRSSIFIDTNLKYIENALETGTDRIELYTEPYARNFPTDPEHAIAGFKEAAERALELGLGLNAGHDLSLENLKYFNDNIPGLLEVSIGHALIADALYFGLENTIQQYRRQLS